MVFRTNFSRNILQQRSLGTARAGFPRGGDVMQLDADDDAMFLGYPLGMGAYAKIAESYGALSKITKLLGIINLL